MNSDSPRLPLTRLAFVGMLVPALFTAVDHWLLSRMQFDPSEANVLLTMGVYVAQIGAVGWLCGWLLVNPWWRWGIYLWSWLLIDLQLLSASVFADGGRWYSHARLLPGSLFAAQVGLAIVWGILGTTRWTIRIPACLVVGAILAIPALDSYAYRVEKVVPIQMISLVVLCVLLRWRRYRLENLTASAAETSVANGGTTRELARSQFTIRHVLIWTTSLALLLGILRGLDLLSLDALRPLVGGRMGLQWTAGIAIAVVFVVAVWAALGAGPAWMRVPILLFALTVVGLGLVLASFLTENNLAVLEQVWLNRYPRSYVWDEHGWFLSWMALAGSLLFASLLILRVIGYRLVRAAKPRPSPQPA
jgi:hypothetical protein